MVAVVDRRVSEPGPARSAHAAVVEAAK